ncbi:MAG: hypothetical protein Q9213_000291 [Squamulea squamosa]
MPQPSNPRGMDLMVAFAEEAVAEVQQDNNQAMATRFEAAPLQDHLAKDPSTRDLLITLMMEMKGTDAGHRVLTAALEEDEKRSRSGYLSMIGQQITRGVQGIQINGLIPGREGLHDKESLGD